MLRGRDRGNRNVENVEGVLIAHVGEGNGEVKEEEERVDVPITSTR